MSKRHRSVTFLNYFITTSIYHFSFLLDEGFSIVKVIGINFSEGTFKMFMVTVFLVRQHAVSDHNRLVDTLVRVKVVSTYRTSFIQNRIIGDMSGRLHMYVKRCVHIIVSLRIHGRS